MKIFYDIYEFAAEVGVRHRQLRRLLTDEHILGTRFKSSYGRGVTRQRADIWTATQVEAFKKTKSFKEYRRREPCEKH